MWSLCLDHSHTRAMPLLNTNFSIVKVMMEVKVDMLKNFPRPMQRQVWEREGVEM